MFQQQVRQAGDEARAGQHHIGAARPGIFERIHIHMRPESQHRDAPRSRHRFNQRHPLPPWDLPIPEVEDDQRRVQAGDLVEQHRTAPHQVLAELAPLRNLVVRPKFIGALHPAHLEPQPPCRALNAG